MLILTGIFVVLVMVVDLCVDIHERFSPNKKNIWTSKWAYFLLITLNILAIVTLSLAVIQEAK